MRTPEESYMVDPMYRTVVDTLETLIRDAQMSPSTMNSERLHNPSSYPAHRRENERARIPRRAPGKPVTTDRRIDNDSEGAAVKQNDGGPAYPCTKPAEELGDVATVHSGMTLRDYFAGQALLGHYAADYQGGEDEFAEWWYRAADAMLAEREIHR